MNAIKRPDWFPRLASRIRIGTEIARKKPCSFQRLSNRPSADGLQADGMALMPHGDNVGHPIMSCLIWTWEMLTVCGVRGALQRPLVLSRRCCCGQDNWRRKRVGIWRKCQIKASLTAFEDGWNCWVGLTSKADSTSCFAVFWKE